MTFFLKKFELAIIEYLDVQWIRREGIKTFYGVTNLDAVRHQMLVEEKSNGRKRRKSKQTLATNPISSELS